MINTFHMAQFKRALELIQGPHPTNGSITQLIKQGEHILNKLRTLPQYSLLLSNYLVQNSQIYAINRNNTHSNNSKMFVVLQLLKQVPISNQVVWWHLLEFYYVCNDKLQNLIIQFINKHVGPSSQLSMYYQPFLSCVAEGSKWGIVFINKMLHLIQALISKFKGIAKMQQVSKIWIIGHLQFIMHCLFQTLRRCNNQLTNYKQVIILKAIKIIKLVSQTNKSQQYNQCTQFCYCAMQTMNTIIKSNENMDRIIKLIYYLCWMAINANYKQSNMYDYSIISELPNIVQTVLRNIHRRYKQYPQILQILTYFIKHSKSNAILNQQLQNILDIYYKYIIDVECKKKTIVMISEIPQTNQQLQQQTNIGINISYIHKYQLLTQCVCRKFEHLQDSILNKSNIKEIVYIAYVNAWESNQQIVNTLLVYLRSALNHQKQASSTNILICCLRFLFRFVLNDPHYNLIQIAGILLGIRTAFRQLQDLCDILLCKATHAIITSSPVQNDTLWDFMRVWVNNLQQNYMDVRAFSYYPILLILQNAEEYHFTSTFTIQTKDKINFATFFLHLIQLIQQQAKNDTNNKYSTEQNSVWIGYIEIFYKMCEIYVKYLLIIAKIQNKQQSSKICSQHTNIMAKILSFVFKNQLFSTETAFLYVHYMRVKNDVDGIMEFISNMMTDSFWRGFDFTKINFYCCVMVGLQLSYQNYFNSQQIYNSLLRILKQFQSTQQISEVQTNKLKYQMSDFALLFDMALPRDIFDFDYDFSHKPKSKEIQQIYL